MLPTQLIVRNYRGYAGEHALELRPLTLLFGRNNAGKSALLRALPLLSASARSRGQQALDLTNPATKNANFSELRCAFPDDERPRKLGLGLRWPSGDALDLTFEWHERRWIHVAGIRVGGPGAPWYESIPLAPERSATDGEPVRFWQPGGDAEQFELRIAGLDISALGKAPAGLTNIGALSDLLTAFGEQVQWLGASRRPRERVAKYHTLTGLRRIAHDGSDIVAWLAEHPQALASINEWYGESLGVRVFVRERPELGHEVYLTHPGAPTAELNLLDTGEGNVQVLPVLAALAAAEGGYGPPIVALEEPESHLHPRMQMALAARIAAVLERAPHVRIVLETHSEHLLLALQKLVLHDFARDKAQLYWVEQRADARTVARPVDIHADGSLGPTWPPGVFDDTLDLAAQLLELQLARQGTES